MKDSTIRVLQALTLFSVAVIGLFLNVIVSLVFYKRPALRSSSNRFVLSLVVANIVSVLGLVPTALYLFIRNTFDCLTHIGSSLIVLVVTASVFSILVIAIDRYNAVLSPLHYSMTVTSQRSKETIAAIWCVSVLLSTPPLLGVFNKRLPVPENEVLRFSYVSLFFTFGFIVPLVILVWVYARMYIAAHKNSERTRRQSIQANAGDCSRGGSVESQYPPIITTLDFIRTAKPPMLSQLHKRRSSNATFSAILFREEGRAVKTAVMVVASFALCWGPYFVVLLLYTLEVVEALSHSVVFISIFPIVINSALSPFIYVFRNEIARNEAVRLMFWWKKIGLYEGNVLQHANKEMKLKASDGGIRIRHQSSSNYDSMSVQSFQLPINYSVECKQCSELSHTPVADFVATYEVVSLKGEPKSSTDVKYSESKTRGESVTFRLAFLPQRRCQTCIRQNSDSSSGSAHPLLKESEPLTPVHSAKRHDSASKVCSADEFQLSKGRICDSPKQVLLRYDKDQTIDEMEENPNSEIVFKPKEEVGTENTDEEVREESDEKSDIELITHSGLRGVSIQQQQTNSWGTNRNYIRQSFQMSPTVPILKKQRHKLQRLLAVEDEEGLTKSKIASKFPPCDFG